MNIKLNYKRTILVGFAFFLISAFWQAYDAIVPLILTNHFGLPQTASGAIMSIDNVLAVFMLPLFGAISDKVNSKYEGGSNESYIRLEYTPENKVFIQQFWDKTIRE